MVVVLFSTRMLLLLLLRGGEPLGTTAWGLGGGICRRRLVAGSGGEVRRGCKKKKKTRKNELEKKTHLCFTLALSSSSNCSLAPSALPRGGRSFPSSSSSLRARWPPFPLRPSKKRSRGRQRARTEERKRAEKRRRSSIDLFSKRCVRRLRTRPLPGQRPGPAAARTTCPREQRA